MRKKSSEDLSRHHAGDGAPCHLKYHTPLWYEDRMAHTVRDKAKLLARVRRIRGQIEATERALEDEQGCSRVLNLIAAARGAINSLMGEVLEGHIRTHVVDPAHEPDKARAQGAEELIEVVRTYLK